MEDKEAGLGWPMSTCHSLVPLALKDWLKLIYQAWLCVVVTTVSTVQVVDVRVHSSLWLMESTNNEVLSSLMTTYFYNQHTTIVLPESLL